MAEANILEKSSKKNKANTDSKMEESDSEEALFEVEKVIGKSKIKGTITYKVRWKGYGAADDTWEPVENLESCLDIIDEYNAQQAEINRKRGEERRMKQLIMEGYISTDNTENSAEDSNSPYPASFKNTFWKELEAGRVNVFDNDMYSKVKGRSVKLSADKQSDDSSPEAALNGEKTKKTRALSNPEASTSKSNKVDDTSHKSKSASKAQIQPISSHSRHDHKSSSSRKIDFKNRSRITIVSESESETEISPVIKVISNKLDDSDSTDNELLRPALNIVIKKIPKDISSDMDKKCTLASQKSEASTASYSVVQKFGSDNGSDRQNTDKTHAGGKDQVDDSQRMHHESGSSSKKKKKHSKHHKHRKHKSSSSSHDHAGSVHGRDKHRDSDRKRKISTSSLPHIDTDNSARTRVKVPKLESNSDRPESEKDKTVINAGDSVFKSTESVFVSQDKSKDDNTIDSNMVKLGLQPSRHMENNTSQASEKSSLTDTIREKTVELAKHNKNGNCNPKASKSVSPSEYFCNRKPERSRVSGLNNNSDDLIKQHLIRSQLSAKDLNVNLSSNSSQVTTHDGQLHLNVKSELDRQDSETVDSGIASPASERSVGLSRTDLVLVNPLDDFLGRAFLPLLPDNDKTQTRGADHDLEISLDDVDWDLFDKEVKLTPITLTNSEFARAVIDGNYELVKQAFMGDGKNDLEHPDASGKTLLMYAAHKGYDDIADLLIENGGNIDAQMNNGMTAVMTACEYAEICTVNLLLEHNCKVNLQCNNGETALMMAAKRGHNQILWLLLECGANFNMTSNMGHTALTYVKHLHYDDTGSIITSHMHRVMSEFDRQVAITMNNTAKIVSSLFPAQVFNICEGETFPVVFQHTLEPHNPGMGFLLFVGHAVFTSQEVKCRFYGPCAVKCVTLNGHQQSPLTQEGNFVLAFSPLVNGKNVLLVNTVRAPEVKAKLIVCAFKAELI